MRRRGASAYRNAVRHLADCKFIEAHDAVRGTRAERPVVDLIGAMCGLVNETMELQDRLDNVLEYYDLREPSADEVYEQWERDNKSARRALVQRKREGPDPGLNIPVYFDEKYQRWHVGSVVDGEIVRFAALWDDEQLLWPNPG